MDADPGVSSREAPPPAGRQPRNVVLCMDGTGNDFRAPRSNVLRMAQVAERGTGQPLFYDPGVGTLLLGGGTLLLGGVAFGP